LEIHSAELSGSSLVGSNLCLSNKLFMEQNKKVFVVKAHILVTENILMFQLQKVRKKFEFLVNKAYQNSLSNLEPTKFGCRNLSPCFFTNLYVVATH